jgi:hypothetical protein
MKKKHLYLVKREVYATSLERAAHSPGKIYAIEQAEEKFQPEDKKRTPGFKQK